MVVVPDLLHLHIQGQKDKTASNWWIYYRKCCYTERGTKRTARVSDGWWRRYLQSSPCNIFYNRSTNHLPFCRSVSKFRCINFIKVLSKELPWISRRFMQVQRSRRTFIGQPVKFMATLLT